MTSKQPIAGAAAERDALAGALERLIHEFDGLVDVDVVTSCISQVNANLGAQPAGTRTVLVERCSRQRLSDAVAQQ